MVKVEITKADDPDFYFQWIEWSQVSASSATPAKIDGAVNQTDFSADVAFELSATAGDAKVHWPSPFNTGIDINGAAVFNSAALTYDNNFWMASDEFDDTNAPGSIGGIKFYSNSVAGAVAAQGIVYGDD